MILILNSINTRFELYKDELYSRIIPVIKTLSLLDDTDVIISDLPIIFYSFSNEKQVIIDSYYLNEFDLEKFKNVRHLYYLKPNSFDDRFKFKVQIDNIEEIIWTDSNYKLLKLNTNDFKNKR